MADNITLNSGSGGSVLKTDDDGTAHWPYSKIAFGADNTQTVVTSTAVNPFPVALSDTDNAVLDAIAASVAGTLTVGSHAVTNAGTFAVQAAQSGTWTVELGATDNAVLDAIAASVAGTLTVGSHAVTNAGTFVVQVDGTALTHLATVAGAVTGTEMQVDIVTDQPIDNTADTITASLDTAALSNDGTLLTPKFAAINATTNGDNTLVAAVVGKKIRVLSYSLVADAAVGCAFEDGAGGTELAGQMAFAANGGISVAFSPVGHFETTANTLLNLETDAVANVRGHLCYVEV